MNTDGEQCEIRYHLMHLLLKLLFCSCNTHLLMIFILILMHLFRIGKEWADYYN